MTIPTGSCAPANPIAIVVGGTNIPNGTSITVSLKTAQGAGSSASAAMNSGSVNVSLTVPSGVSYLQASTATFTISAELQRDLPLFEGERILTASVEFDGSRDHAYFFTESGRRVTAEQLFNK